MSKQKEFNILTDGNFNEDFFISDIADDEDNGEYYKLSDLKEGMRVNTYQLAKIYDTYILMEDTKLLDDGSTEGTIIFIGPEANNDMRKKITISKNKYHESPFVFAHSSALIGGDIYIE